MIKLLKLYSLPEIFTPIEFDSGVNIILGEKVESSRKTNGVGKSMCIEFINFCLLKQVSKSRIMKIPGDVFPPETKICLDLEINLNLITIARSRQSPDKPIIIKEGHEDIFDSLDNALNYLTDLFYNKQLGVEYPSFRELLGPLIRDESSEFKDIVHCYNTNLRIPPNYIPHLYLFDIDLEPYEKAKVKIKEIAKESEYIRKLKNEITNHKSQKLSDVKAELNSMTDELTKVGEAIEGLKSNEAFEAIQKDLTNIENELDNLRIRRKIIEYELKKMRSLPKPEFVSETDIEIIYNQFKQGLGEIIERSLNQVKNFKSKIDHFQETLINSKIKFLSNDLEKITERIRLLDDDRAEKMRIIDQKGILKDFKTSLAIYNKKSEEISKIRSQFIELEAAERQKKVLTLSKDELIVTLDNSKAKIKGIIESFNATILEIHELIMGNKKASFSINIINKGNNKEIISFEMRIFDDGSRSVDRTKVFIYDMSLMFNKHTRERHPKLLIHDNIFDVDQDTLVQSLNFLAKQEELYSDFQYILTLNRDKIESEERQRLIVLDIEKHRRAKFTKENKFLKKNYQEI